MSKGTLLALTIALACGACTSTVHPKDPGIPHALCAPRCEREHECDAQVDVADCEARCEHQKSPRVVYNRADYVAQMRDCALRQACTRDVDDEILRCQRDALRRLEPSPAARTYCANYLNKNASCRVWHDQSWDYAHCIDGVKLFTDAILAQLDECNDGPCRAREMCILDVIGRDEVVDDESYRQKARAVPVADPGRPTVSFHGVVSSESPRKPLGDVSVCIVGTKTCTRTQDDGSYVLPVPAHADLAVSFEALGYEVTINPFSTAGKDVGDSLALKSVDAIRGHYAAVSATVPDPSTGVLVVRAFTMEKEPRGIDGVAFSLDVAPGKAPFYRQPDGAVASDRTSTSTNGGAAFVGLAPGTVEVTATGPGVVCTPYVWAWPSEHANSVRAPVVAGATTVVKMQCHK